MTPAAAAAPLGGDSVAEFLSVIAEAPDFATAAQFVCEQFAKFSGASRALLFTLGGLWWLTHLGDAPSYAGFTVR